MKHKHFILIYVIFFAFTFNFAQAKKVEIKAAKNVALNAYKENYSNVFNKNANGVFITEEFTVSENSIPVYYVFNMSNQGFVIVAADDIVQPILGYSFESFYQAENQSPEFMSLMNNYKQQIVSDVSLKLSATPDIEQEWSRYNVKPENFILIKGTKLVTPLLVSTWDQGCCYNAFCPADAAATSSCGKVWVGCVATSMAQVMYYWRYPAQGQGSHSYTPGSWGGTSYPTQSVNFGTTTYNWNAMTDACVGTNDEIAKLSWHCGVAVNMSYGVDGSAANLDGTNGSANALKNYFKYSTSLYYADKSSYSSTAWENLLKADLDNKRPVLYDGFGNDGGHAFVCDGYDASSPTKFHFNWGWSGAYNGYFALTALNPGGMDFTQGQGAIFNIYPGSNYPAYCAASPATLTSATGTLTDGSGTSDYQNNADCSWLIAPSVLVDHLVINFESMSTEASNDVVTIYDGSTTSDPVLGTYSGSSLPAQVVSTAPEVLVRFTTNGSTTDAGWFLNYYSVYPVFCGTTTLTASSGSIDDGSGVNDYNNNSSCTWEIMPTGASSVTLHFLTFSLEASFDKVRVVDASSNTLLGTYSGTTIPADVTSPSGQMRVLFNSNATITDAGFSATYSSYVGVDEYNTLKDFSVYPNPANDELHISFAVADGNVASVQLFDLTGQSVFSENVSDNNVYNKSLNISSFAKGIYNLQVITSGETINKKVVIE